nr:MAG TPA: hypothetical protein [Caudoviricetes sp.]DAS82160.1 MAG TPA: hypothetical protein [Caudoviricetes sp.]DAS96849.1 MAG TPA: hypothetical protein [Caudoviricetes sp.]
MIRIKRRRFVRSARQTPLKTMISVRGSMHS